MKKKSKICLAAAVFFLSMLLPIEKVTANETKIDEKHMVKLLEQILNEHPDLVLNVLRKNSELVLDIAQDGSTKRRKRSLEAQWRQDRKIDKDVNIKERPIWGKSDAPITVVEFSDFTCPYCQQAANNLKLIMKDYPNDIRLVFKHTPLSSSPISILASEFVIAAGYQSKEKARELYEAIFEKRAKLLEQGEEFLKAEAQRIGLNVTKLEKDAGSKKTEKILEEDLADATNLSVEGTPYFLVNNIVIRGALPYELFKAAFEFELSQQK